MNVLCNTRIVYCTIVHFTAIYNTQINRALFKSVCARVCALRVRVRERERERERERARVLVGAITA